MKLLFDENLSRKLPFHLAALFPGSIHLSDAGLLQSPDQQVWEYAKAGGFIVVTTDSDFFELATTFGPPPKVIWLRRWAHPTRDAEMLLRGSAIRIAEFAKDGDVAVLILDKF